MTRRMACPEYLNYWAAGTMTKSEIPVTVLCQMDFYGLPFNVGVVVVLPLLGRQYNCRPNLIRQCTTGRSGCCVDSHLAASVAIVKRASTSGTGAGAASGKNGPKRKVEKPGGKVYLLA